MKTTVAVDGGLACVAADGRAAAACGASTGMAATSMEEKGPAGSCTREKLGALVDWADGGHPSFFNRSGHGHGSYAKGEGERPSGAAYVESSFERSSSSASAWARSALSVPNLAHGGITVYSQTIIVDEAHRSYHENVGTL
ncbi:uncharacterized protein [Triticum aestivum]|uniref:uncharacterized protein n=1 Tax=Triticum aestivum TaxID=4565 RepID=UPI001D015A86|nr:uncharacterized protein LOC123137792 [Triticum aestivum]